MLTIDGYISEDEFWITWRVVQKSEGEMFEY